MKNTSLHLVNKDCLPLTKMPSGTLNNENIETVRQQATMGLGDPGIPEDVICQTIVVTKPEQSDVEILLISPREKTKSPSPLLIFLHGGGMVMGKVDQALYDLPESVKRYGISVASIKYRLAPEHSFPSQQEDLLLAYEWLLENHEHLNIDRNKIIIMGISAGGGLAASFTQMLRDKYLPQLAAQILIYPMLDARTGSPESLYNNTFAGEYVWTKENNQYGWQALQGDYPKDDERRGWFSASLADNLSDLPPTFMATGSLDLFLDENVDYSRRLINAGVSTELHVYQGAIHAFNIIPNSNLTSQYKHDLERLFDNLFT